MAAVSPLFTQTDSTRQYAVDAVTVIEARSGLTPARIPFSASVLEISARSALRPDALAASLESIPGVFAASRSGGTDLRLTIRGFGARGNGDRSNSGTIRGIKVLLDGIPLTEPDGRTSPDLLTFIHGGRIEVLRTNASSLFGNASGGIINVETPEPEHAPEWSLSSSAGSFGHRKAMARIGLPFEAGSVSLSGGWMTLDGWRANSAADAASVYAVTILRPSSELRIRVTLGITRHRFSIPGALTEDEFAADPSQPDPEYLARRERRNNLVGLSSVQITRAIGARQSIAATVYLGPKTLVRSERNTYREFQRWSGGGGFIWRWMPGASGTIVAIGIDGSLQDGNSLFYSLKNGERGDSLRTNKAERAASAGAFVETSTTLWNAWTVAGGIRFDEQRYRSSVFPAGATLTTRIEELMFRHATPHLALSVAVDQQHSFFGALSGGLEVPAFNEVDPPPGIGAADLNPLLKPMTSSTVEVGHRFRGPLTDGWTLATSAALYLITVRNEIVPFNNGAWFLSAGRSRRLGGEAFAAVRSALGFEAEISWTQLKGTYQEFRTSAGTYDGNVVPGIPSQTIVARIRYRTPFGLAVEVGGRRVGPLQADDANTLTLPASSILDAGLSWTTTLADLALTARVDVRNLLDASSAAGAFINPVTRPSQPYIRSLAAPAYIEPGLPRSVLVSVSVGAAGP